MDLKQEYKKTEVGVIPKDWEVKKLGDVLKLQRGFDLPHRYRVPGPIPIISSAGVCGTHNEFLAESPGVVTGRYGTIGEVFYIETNYWPLNTTLFVKSFKSNYPLYTFHLLKTIDFKTHSGKSGVPGVNRNDLHEILIPHPLTLAEQTAIATALSDADALISRLETLINKKRAIKQGAMQQLLKPKEGWEVKKLGEVAEIDPENLNSSTQSNYSFHYISLEDVDCGVLRNTTELLFKDAPSRARRKLRKNDILVSTVRPNLKSHYHVKEVMKDFVCSTGFCVVRCFEGIADGRFVYSHFFGSIINNQIDGLITGSNYPAINSRDVKNLEIPFPDFEEQTRIAQILSDMDAEIAVLEQNLSKYRQLKQGMMQELLTGKTRLV